ncbi:MAG: DNA polymerase I [Deltaproteobacteria bacterium]|jgi:DNA polymerase-1|nr:DNA polymerase I [Deltaproteobacteria bacterium]MCL5879971.1 DNA polymerase I [Deltaproteobacteria bacterium]MDA8304373.1 DNA polymerase I [Deltaproteobacteria bacterium]
MTEQDLPQKKIGKKSRPKAKEILDIKADLFLIDSSSYFYRAYYALPPLTNSKGIPTGATLGYTRMLMKLIKEANIRYGACLFDSHESLRKQSYEEYKAHRKGMPEDLLSQVDYLTDISYLLGFNTFRLKGYEADDLIAYIVTNFSEKLSISTCIVSSDKDLKQLLSDRVFIYDALKNKIITAQGFEEEYGIKPDEYLYVLALMGDASDNIPGIKGIGDKTAFSLIRTYKSLDGVYENINGIKQQKLKDLLINHKEEAYKSLELASFYKDIDINGAYFTPESKEFAGENGKSFHTLDDFAMRQKDGGGLYNIFKKLEFNSLLKELETGMSGKDSPSGNYYNNNNKDNKDSKILSIYIDFEGKNIDLPDFNFEGDNGGDLIYIFSKETGTEIINLKDLAGNPRILNLLKDDSVYKTGYDLTSIKRFLEKGGIRLTNLFFDIKIASYLLNPIRHSHSFTDIKKEFENELKGLSSKDSGLPEDSNVQIDTLNKAFSVYILYKIFEAEIEKDVDLKYLFYNLDMPLSMVLSDMEDVGFMVDKDKLMSLSVELDTESKRLASALYKIAGKEFNVNSPKQLSEIMFNEMKFNRVKKNSTDIEVLSTLKSELELLLRQSEDKTIRQYSEFIDSLMSYRNKVKLKTSFTDVLLKEIDKDNRVHTSLSQITTSTGRLASQSPNLQNIPASGVEGTKIRQSFIAKSGCLLLSADYSQIDLRVMASISGDKALIESFRNNEDIHAKTASEIFKVAPDAIDSAMRRKAKVINFGIIYGMSSYGLSKELNISAEEAKLYIDLYFKNHPAIKDYMDLTVKEAKSNGFVRTAFGRKCYVENINSQIKNLASFSERAAINAPIQGTAADIIKIAMVNIHKRLQDSPELKKDAKMILQVHDELIFEVKESLVNELKDIVTVLMTDKNLLANVPLVINIGVGRNWAEAH